MLMKLTPEMSERRNQKLDSGQSLFLVTISDFESVSKYYTFFHIKNRIYPMLNQNCDNCELSLTELSYLIT
jgi:hypothetical protein